MALSIWLSSFIFQQMHSIIKTPLYLLSKPGKQIYSLSASVLDMKIFSPAHVRGENDVRVRDNSERVSDQSGATMTYVPPGSRQFIR